MPWNKLDLLCGRAIRSTSPARDSTATSSPVPFVEHFSKFEPATQVALRRQIAGQLITENRYKL
jgi:hypothetical protein